MLFPPAFAQGMRDKQIWQLNGDQAVLSQDVSLMRSGSGSFIGPGSPLYTLLGNQLAMWYLCHNSAIDESGKFMPRDDPGGCSLTVWCEDDTVRFYGAPAAAKGTLPVWTLYTTYNQLTGLWTYVGGVSPSQTAGVVGTNAANNANAGALGEYLTATIATPGTTLTTATSANVITAGLSLTAGDWDVWASCCFLPAATTSITQLQWGLSSTTGTLPAAGSGLATVVEPATVPGVASPICMPVQQIRVSQASTLPVYLVAQGTFTLSTLSAFGTIYARRAR